MKDFGCRMVGLRTGGKNVNEKKEWYETGFVGLCGTCGGCGRSGK